MDDQEARWRRVIWRDFFGYSLTLEEAPGTSEDSTDDNDDDSDDEDPWRAALDRVPQNPQDDQESALVPTWLNAGGLPPNVGAAGSGGLPPIVEGPPTGGLPPNMGGSPPDPSDDSSDSGSTLNTSLASSLTEDIANGVWERGAGLPRQPVCWGFPMPDFTLMLDDGDTSVLSQPSALRPPSTASSPPLSAEALKTMLCVSESFGGTYFTDHPCSLVAPFSFLLFSAFPNTYIVFAQG